MTDKASARGETVLVTGGAGYVASWAITYLLRAGYDVRATLRNLARADEVRAMVAREIDPGARLDFVKADLTADEGWALAATGCRYVLHVASPMSPADIRGPEAIAVAAEGALRVLRASAEAGVNRVVMTSSTSAARAAPGQAVVDERTWTAYGDSLDNPMEIYSQSKTRAERAAWDFVAGLGGAMELATVLPGMIQGPVLGTDYALSVEIIAQLLKGRPPLYPTPGIEIVDVRDLADLHVRAMTAPAAAGERFLATSAYTTFADMSRFLREHFGARAPAIPTLKAPAATGQVDFSSAKARDRLDWRPRPVAQTIIDTAESLLSTGAVELDPAG